MRSPAGPERLERELFERGREAFQRAVAATGEVVRDLRIAGTDVRLRFAGESLLSDLTLALDPWAGALDGPPFEICVWDAASTGVPMPSLDLDWADFTTRGNIWGLDDDRYRVAFKWGEGSVSLMDRAAQVGLFWVPHVRVLREWVVSAPFRTLLHWWLQEHQLHLVHAAAVGYQGRGVLIPGRGGSGKSSTALACLGAGMDYLGDDYLAIGLEPRPRAFALYAVAKADDASLARVPELASLSRRRDPGWRKTLLLLDGPVRGQVRRNLLLDRFLVPIVTGEPGTSLGPAEPLDVERALTAETLVHLPHTGARTVDFLNDLSHAAHAATLRLGTDRRQVVDAVMEALTPPLPPRSQARPDRRPRVSVIVHIREDEEELRRLAEHVASQGYPRIEPVFVNDGGEPFSSLVRELAGDVRMFELENRLLPQESRNRGIREAFSELLLFLEPGDRWPPGTLDALVGAAVADPEASVVRGRVTGRGGGEAPARPLGGAIVRRRAFRRHGLIPSQPDGETTWLARAERAGLVIREIPAVTLEAGSTSPAEGTGETHRLLMDVKTHLDGRRRG